MRGRHAPVQVPGKPSAHLDREPRAPDATPGALRSPADEAGSAPAVGAAASAGPAPCCSRSVGRYPLERERDTSHQRLLRWFAERPAMRVLELGCGPALLASEIRGLGHFVVGVDVD